MILFGRPPNGPHSINSCVGCKWVLFASFFCNHFHLQMEIPLGHATINLSIRVSLVVEEPQ